VGKQQKGVGGAEELESRLVFLDDLVESLNAVVARQDRELVRLQRRVEDLENKLADLAEASTLPGAPPGPEILPHY
jgi:uncharacterized coiled-coil protein SlyX